MPICSNCNQYELTKDDWFCRYCGDRRETCPSCGGNLNTEECESCDQPRYGPCTECGELTPVTGEECQNCGYNDVESMKSRSWKFVGGGIILVFSGGFMIPGLLGTIGYLIGIPMILVGLIIAGLGAFELIFPTRTGPVGEVGLSMGEKDHMSKEYEKEIAEEAIDAVGVAASAGAEALDTYTEYKKDKQKREENKRKKQERQKIKENRKKTEDAAQEARESHLSILWEMNCENCGAPWMTTQNRHLIRNDEFDTIGFKIVNEREWNYIQDSVQLQCDAPDCNNTSRFTKDSLWDP